MYATILQTHIGGYDMHNTYGIASVLKEAFAPRTDSFNVRRNGSLLLLSPCFIPTHVKAFLSAIPSSTRLSSSLRVCT